MVHFKQLISLRWIFVGVLLTVGFLGLRWTASSEAQAQAQDKDRRLYQKAVEEAERALKEVGNLVAPLPRSKFLEKDKQYTFYWPTKSANAVVAEEPRDNWVKVKVKVGIDRKGQEVIPTQWINLNTVESITEITEAEGNKEAKKGAVKPKGTIKGMVILKGEPVQQGTITFHPENGKAVEAEIKDGQYAAEGVSVGSHVVTVKAGGVAAVYANWKTTPLTIDVNNEENQTVDIKLK